jgi:hypothetical protein
MADVDKDLVIDVEDITGICLVCYQLVSERSKEAAGIVDPHQPSTINPTQ